MVSTSHPEGLIAILRSPTQTLYDVTTHLLFLLTLLPFPHPSSLHYDLPPLNAGTGTLRPHPKITHSFLDSTPLLRHSKLHRLSQQHRPCTVCFSTSGGLTCVTMPETTKVVPLTCHGHSRPVPHIHFSSIVDEDQYYIISACKDGNPMLRDGVTGDWIGTFLGHKGAVWQARLSSDASLAATASADFSAYVRDTECGTHV